MEFKLVLIKKIPYRKELMPLIKAGLKDGDVVIKKRSPKSPKFFFIVFRKKKIKIHEKLFAYVHSEDLDRCWLKC